MVQKNVKYLLSTTAIAGLFFVAANANAGFTPKLSGEAVFEVQDEFGYESDDDANERNNLFGRVEVAPELALTENITIDGVLVTEPVQDGDPGDDTYFDNEGTFIEELKINFKKDNYAVYAGKFNPGFGTAWDYGRGIWGEDFAEDYEITEKLGFGGAYTFGNDKVGTHTVNASTFFADTTFLTRSAFTGRGDVERPDGGASNNEDFESFAGSVEGDNAGGIEGLGYHVAYRHLEAGDVNTGANDERGFAVSANYVFPLTSNIEEDILVEYASIRNFDGADDDREYITTSLITRIMKNWNITLSHTGRDVEVAGIESNDHLYQVTGGYTFENGLSLEAGYRNAEESDVDTNVVGFLTRYTASF